MPHNLSSQRSDQTMRQNTPTAETPRQFNDPAPEDPALSLGDCRPNQASTFDNGFDHTSTAQSSKNALPTVTSAASRGSVPIPIPSTYVSFSTPIGDMESIPAGMDEVDNHSHSVTTPASPRPAFLPYNIEENNEAEALLGPLNELLQPWEAEQSGNCNESLKNSEDTKAESLQASVLSSDVRRRAVHFEDENNDHEPSNQIQEDVWGLGLSNEESTGLEGEILESSELAIEEPDEEMSDGDDNPPESKCH